MSIPKRSKALRAASKTSAVPSGIQHASVLGAVKNKPPLAFDKANAHLADSGAVVFTEIGDDLVVGNKPPQEPHNLKIAASLAFQTAARLHPVQIAIDIQF